MKTMLKAIALCLPMVICAQERSHPFVGEGKVWNYFISTDVTYSYTMLGDTVISGKVMKKLYATDPAVYGDSQLHYVGAVHETDGRVTFTADGETAGSTFCDFRKMKGDSCFIDDDRYRIVYSSSYLMVNSEVRHYQNLLGLERLSDSSPEQVATLYPALEGMGLLTVDPFRAGKNHSNYLQLASCYENGRCVYYAKQFFNPVADKYYVPVNADYLPLLREGRQWSLDDGSSRIVSGDTTLQEVYYGEERKMIYRKVFCKDSRKYGNDLLHYEKSVTEYGKKVYEVPAGQPATKKRLLFDFALKVGDSFQFEDRQNAYAVVVDCDSVCSMGCKRRRLTLQLYENGKDTSQLFHWIEGIGNDGGIAQSYSMPDSHSALTVMDGTSCIYDSDASGNTEVTFKCTTPTITYDKGRLVFSCETPGAECVYEIKCADTGSGRGTEVSLNKTYEIRVHATLDGWDDSDVAVATIGWRNGQPVMEGFSGVTLDSGDSGGDVNGDGKVDVADITAIISYMSQEGRRDYVPFVEEGKAWYCEYDHFDVDQPPLKDPMGNSIDCIFTMHGDTLINDREYKKVYCQFEEYYGDKEQHYYCAVREKAYQVFIIEGETMEEKLIYDFNHPKELINITYNGFKFARTGGYHRYDYLPGQLEYSVCSYSGNEVSNGSSYWFDGVGAPLNNPFAFELPFLPFDEPKLGKDIVVRTCMKDGKCIYMLDWLAEPIEPYKDDRGQVPVTPVK